MEEYAKVIHIEALTSLDVSSFDTSNVTNMNGMFGGCYALTTLDLSSFNTSSVKNMGYMFQVCKALTSVDVSSFDTSNVTKMDSMFSGCVALEVLDLGSFDMSNVRDAKYMFQGCNNLRTIYASDAFAISRYAACDSMFGYCYALVGGMGTAYDSMHVGWEYARIDGGTAAPGYLAMKRGDVSGNGRLNVVDAQLAYDIALGKCTALPDYAAMRSRADVTGAPGGGPDGQVTANDAFAIQYAALRGWGA